MSSNPLCCFVIGAEEPGHLEGAVPGEAAGLSPPPAASAANTAGQMPRFPLLHLVTRPALGKRRGLRGPALELGFEWLGVQRHRSVRLALWLEVQAPTHLSSSPRPVTGRGPVEAAGDSAVCVRRWDKVFPCIHSLDPWPWPLGCQCYLSLTAGDSRGNAAQCV